MRWTRSPYKDAAADLEHSSAVVASFAPSLVHLAKRVGARPVEDIDDLDGFDAFALRRADDAHAILLQRRKSPVNGTQLVLPVRVDARRALAEIMSSLALKPSDVMWTTPQMQLDRSAKIVQDAEEILTRSEVAKMFKVNPKTVTRWARAGKISAIRTLGGHRRFRRSEVEAAMRAEEGPS